MSSTSIIKIGFIDTDKRPKCLFCNKRMVETDTAKHHIDDDFNVTITKTATGHFGYLGNDSFCSMRCGYKYGLMKARIKKGKQ